MEKTSEFVYLVLSKWGNKTGLAKKESMMFLNYMSGISQKKEGRLDWFPVHPYYSFRPAPDSLELFWRIEFSIMALSNGRQEIREALSLKNQLSYFDGFHSYLLYPDS